MQTVNRPSIPKPQSHPQPGRVGDSYASVPLGSAEQLKQRREEQKKAEEQELFDRVRAKQAELRSPKPMGYERAAFNTPEYWRDCQRGWITDEEQLEDQAAFEIRRKRAVDSKYNKAATPHRHHRAAPRTSKQFSKPMSTQGCPFGETQLLCFQLARHAFGFPQPGAWIWPTISETRSENGIGVRY